jgi:PAS domain S-box-containing protein
MLASAAFLSVLGVYAWKHRTVPGAGPFAVQMAFSALWAGFAAIEMAAMAEPTKVFWFRLERMMAPPAMTALLFFALEYANSGKWMSRRNALVLSAPALFATVLMATNDLHHLFWTRLWFDDFVRFELGPLNSVFVGYILLLPTLALLIFLRLVLRSRGVYRGQVFLLLTGNALPLLAYLLQRTGINPVAPLDLTILMLNITGLLFTLAIYRFGMMSVVPVGRGTALEHMAEGVLILDAENRIADMNPAARAALALSPRDSIGRPALEILAGYPDLSSIAMQEGAIETEISVNAGGQLRLYQAHASPLVDSGGYKLGRLISLQDVTEQKRARERLVHQQRTVAILQERERLARELHDCLGQALASAHLQAETAQVLLEQGATEQVAVQLRRLADVTQAANTDIREYLLGMKTELAAEKNFIVSLRTCLRKFSEYNTCQTELVVSPELETQFFDPTITLQLLRIIQEALTNVRKHAAAHTVRMTLARPRDRLEVTLTDDGRGFEPSQLGDHGGYGLRSMRERAESIGGIFEFHSAPGQGTRLQMRVPMAEPQGSGGD